MIGLTAAAASKLLSPTGRRLAFLALISAPIALVYFARALFNRTIDTELIDFRFFGSMGVVHGSPDYILPQVTEALYVLGFAICGTVALSIALIVASLFLVYGNFRQAFRRRAHIFIMLGFAVVIFVGLAFDATSQGPNLKLKPSIGRISLMLLGQTIGKLPSCQDSGMYCDPDYTIGADTDKNLMRFVSFTFGLVAAAGFAYCFSIALVATHVRYDRTGVVKSDADAGRKAINDISILAAITFVSTIVVANNLFEPGKQMLEYAVSEEGWRSETAVGETPDPFESEVLRIADQPADPEEAEPEPQPEPDTPNAEKPTPAKEALDRYGHLRTAMTLYWAVIFSMAIAASFFPALIYQAAVSGGSISVDSFWEIAKKVITALSPVIGAGVITLLSNIVDSF